MKAQIKYWLDFEGTNRDSLISMVCDAVEELNKRNAINDNDLCGMKMQVHFFDYDIRGIKDIVDNDCEYTIVDVYHSDEQVKAVSEYGKYVMLDIDLAKDLIVGVVSYPVGYVIQLDGAPYLFYRYHYYN